MGYIQEQQSKEVEGTITNFKAVVDILEDITFMASLEDNNRLDDRVFSVITDAATLIDSFVISEEFWELLDVYVDSENVDFKTIEAIQILIRSRQLILKKYESLLPEVIDENGKKTENGLNDNHVIKKEFEGCYPQLDELDAYHTHADELKAYYDYFEDKRISLYKNNFNRRQDIR